MRAGNVVRLSTIELLPPEADQDVAWVLDQVIVRRGMAQQAALRELNRRLAAKAVRPVTSSAFNRAVVGFRHTGIPARFSVGAPRAQSPIDPLTILIDARVEEALRRRGLEVR